MRGWAGFHVFWLLERDCGLDMEGWGMSMRVVWSWAACSLMGAATVAAWGADKTADGSAKAGAVSAGGWDKAAAASYLDSR